MNKTKRLTVLLVLLVSIMMVLSGCLPKIEAKTPAKLKVSKATKKITSELRLGTLEVSNDTRITNQKEKAGVEQKAIDFASKKIKELKKLAAEKKEGEITTAEAIEEINEILQEEPINEELEGQEEGNDNSSSNSNSNSSGSNNSGGSSNSSSSSSNSSPGTSDSGGSSSSSGSDSSSGSNSGSSDNSGSGSEAGSGSEGGGSDDSSSGGDDLVIPDPNDSGDSGEDELVIPDIPDDTDTNTETGDTPQE